MVYGKYIAIEKAFRGLTTEKKELLLHFCLYIFL